VERFENGSDIVRYCKQHEQDSFESVEAMKLTVWKVMIERVTVVKFRKISPVRGLTVDF